MFKYTYVINIKAESNKFYVNILSKMIFLKKYIDIINVIMGSSSTTAVGSFG